MTQVPSGCVSMHLEHCVVAEHLLLLLLLLCTVFWLYALHVMC